MKAFRDPVHDFISWRDDPATGELLEALVNSREVQRLRGIRQLGLASLVYHGAEHSRFAHSFGVAWLAWRMVRNFKDVDQEERELITAAALLHDIGHAPFSHVMERVFNFHHEHWSMALILDPTTEVNRVLNAHRPGLADKVAARLSGEDGHWSRAILASQFDADRSDYLLRDSMMTGIGVGRFDLERIIWMLGHDEDGLWIDERAWEAVEGYLLARHHMYRLVYFHHSARAAEAMLLQTFERARRLHHAGSPGIVTAGSAWARLFDSATDYPPDAADSQAGEPKQPADYQGELNTMDWLSLRDAQLWCLLQEWSVHPDKMLALLAGGLLDRRLFKVADRQDEQNQISDEVAVARAGALRLVLTEDELDLIGVDLARDTPYSPYRPGQASQKAIRLRKRNGEMVRIEDRSPVVAALAAAPTNLRRIYAHPLILNKVQSILADFDRQQAL